MEDEDKNSKSLVLITRVGSTPTTGIRSSLESNDFGLLFLFSENAAPQPPGHPVLPRGRLELDLLFQRPVCRRRRHRALEVAGAAAALNIFCQKALTTANAHDRITDDFERRCRTGSFQSNFPMDRPAGLRPYGQPGPLPTGGTAAIID